MGTRLLRLFAERLATARLRTACVALTAVLAASCSATGDGSPRAGPSGFGSTLASVLSQAEAQLSSETADDQIASGFAGEDSGGTPPSSGTGRTEAGLPDAVGFAPAENPAAHSTAAVGPAPSPPPAPSAAPAATAVVAETAAQPPAKTFLESGPGPAPAQPPEKRTFLSSLFATGAAAAPRAVVDFDDKPAPAAAPDKTEKTAKPLVKLASTGGKSGESRPVFSGEALPGVRQGSLFEITRKSGLDDDSDIDVHEDEPSYQVASAAGLARLAPNGLLKQSSSVDVACLKPSLVRMLKGVEQHFGKKMIITSGYRDPERNRAVRGARNSMHMYCAAADVQLPGVDKHRLAAYVRALPGRGGVGTYCHTNSIHIDIGPERDWNWRCRAPKG